MKVKKFLHTRMRVSDMDQTIAFYTGVLGLEVLERKVSPRGSHLAFLKVPNSEELIELTSFPPSGPVKVQEDLIHLAFHRCPVRLRSRTHRTLGGRQDCLNPASRSSFPPRTVRAR